ncbi:hypothetical protein FOA52_001688 [Chlamydomonas sp. UWO 241]|nr:hypothetical protein FOA52_001688 [Chlamydomonas sp. UWO 241]
MSAIKLGTLEVSLKTAQNLLEVDKLGKQDPYCVLTCGNYTHRSKTHTDAGANPIWNEVFTFRNVTSNVLLKLEFYDENLIFRDVRIGVCKVSLNEAAASGKATLVVPVTSKDGTHKGSVTLELKFLDNTAASTAPVAEKSQWILPNYGGKDCKADYDIGRVLGKGSFGTTYLATKKGTNEQYAIKVISKRKLTTPEEIQDVRGEVQILHHLAGHLNVVCVGDVYEDKYNVCIVMDCCSGGELFDAIVARGSYSEKDAAELIRVIVGVVAHCHQMGVIHRDLKPENFLISSKGADAQLKATDFGLSTFFQENRTYTDIVGSPYYVAPEVLRRAYSKEADIWSCGVMLYILLCGFPPFSGSNEKAIFRNVMSQPLDFSQNPWPKISEPAKDCVRRMLQRDPKKRATAQEILQHEWMKENGCASGEPISNEVVTRIRKFSAGNRLKKEAIKLIASSLPTDEINGMREIFLAMDTDKSGSISADEFALALQRKGNAHLKEEDVKRLVADADIDGDGQIDYEEFLAATINASKLQREDNLKAAFEHFDLDGDGQITHDELIESLSKMGIKEDQVKDIVAEVDKDGNGVIDYNEFCAMMRESL